MGDAIWEVCWDGWIAFGFDFDMEVRSRMT